MGDFDFKTTSFELKGFAELYRAIDHLPEVVRKAELEPILIECLTPMMVTAIRLAPDDPRTGAPWNLFTSIDVGTRQRSGRAKSDRALGRFDARAYMGPTKEGYPQAVMQEFGFHNRAGGQVVAQPYMRPAYEAEKNTALRIISEKLGDRLTMIARQYAAKG